ncbi:ABC transporter ATP-binding protein [Aestuariibaculum suncheonense]|uniref:ABC transporter ATP-binding protein n=1 Tax=Aestuariibaculum suncheonense TaxID=1028745 RepID=A0A8J6UEF6_9FLAO|nr:ABC transporter ATP-binding protein [Aestuariibaculum suncheonense]
MNEHKDRENNEVLVRVEGLSKKFCKDLKTGLWYGVQDLFSNMRGNTHERLLRPKEFWAVKDVSFELRRGECLGLIGHNGAGKSTLLKILNGLINPDAGKVTIRGRVGALIELGAGFNPILSGRENIYNNGAILGFSRQEIDAKLETIIAFAELEEFIDMPVQHYSSGMKVRLGFAVAAQMQPDVLIIDEVLAVGDLGFVLKCFNTIDQLLPNTAMVFVSHSMPMVSRICNQIMLMDHGNVEYQGADVGKGIDLYYTRFASNETNVVYDDGSVELKSVKLISNDCVVNDLPQLNWGDDLKLEFNFELKEHIIDVPVFNIILFDKEQRPVAVLENNMKTSVLKVKNRTVNFRVNHNDLQLSKGIYSINIIVLKSGGKEPMLRMNNILNFQVVHDSDIWQPFLLKTEYKNYV